MWICPKCKSKDHLGVSVITSANLTQDDNDDNFETEIEGDHEWDNNSTMWCTGCGHSDIALAFECNLPIQPTNPCGPMPNTSLSPRTRRYTDV